MAQRIFRLKKILIELKGPVRKQWAESGEVVGNKAALSVSNVGNKVILRVIAKGDRSRAMILKLSRTKKKDTSW